MSYYVLGYYQFFHQFFKIHQMRNQFNSSKRFQMMVTACVLSVLNVPSSFAKDASQNVLQAAVIAEEIPHTKDSLSEVKTRVESKIAALLDIRESSEWNDGHLKLAILIPLSELKSSNPSAEVKKALEALDKSEPIYCHCRSGRRVLTAAPLLKKMGFDVRPLKAGFEELSKNGFEVAKP
jgi:phage shock protein E